MVEAGLVRAANQKRFSWEARDARLDSTFPQPSANTLPDFVDIVHSRRISAAGCGCRTSPVAETTVSPRFLVI